MKLPLLALILLSTAACVSGGEIHCSLNAGVWTCSGSGSGGVPAPPVVIIPDGTVVAEGV